MFAELGFVDRLRIYFDVCFKAFCGYVCVFFCLNLLCAAFARFSLWFGLLVDGSFGCKFVLIMFCLLGFVLDSLGVLGLFVV